jgi:ubiquinone/menaquinone biosynthesis C-methylase UbiE
MGECSKWDNMRRTLESEIMDDEEQAAAYAQADFSSSNQTFVDMLLQDYGPGLTNVLDIGCGPGDVPIRLVKARPGTKITAVDASDPMIRLAQEAVQEAGVEEQIKVIKGRVPGLGLESHSFDTILSKDFLHHLPSPMVFWDEAKLLANSETVVYVMDLLRPETEDDARHIVESVSAAESPLLKQDFYNSLLAAFTIGEIKEQLCKAGLALEVAKVSERHLLVKGLIRGRR